MFEQLRNDNYILDIYQKIDIPEYNENFWTYHGLTHVNNVIEMVEKILIQLDYDEEFIDNAKIAALLHDLGMIEGKDGHAVRSYELSKKYLENINLKYKNEVLEAIKLHRDSLDTDNVMAIVLIFADKIDVKKSRLAPDGYKVEGLRQYQFIEDINVIKKDNSFTVQFVVNDKCNKEELEKYYFTPKVFRAIENFANQFSFDLKILWNNNVWKLNN